MDSDQGKLFIGGISWETSEDTLREYFGQYGEVLQVVIMKDKVTGKPRGFGFVAFADPSVLDGVLQDKHTIDGRTVEAKRALSREEQQTSSRSGNYGGGRNIGGGALRTKKIFVGGLPSSLTEEGFQKYFEKYGNVTDVVVMYDQSTQRPRGFGFVSFDSEDAVDKVVEKNFHELFGKTVEVKRALPKDANPSGGGSTMGYGNSNLNSNSYDGRMDTSRYMQSQGGGNGYPNPTYGSSGFGGTGYGYNSSNNSSGFSGYGVGGYGATNAGYGNPAATYGGPNMPGANYVNGPPGLRNQWSNQAPTGYGSTGYGAPAPWAGSGASSGGDTSGSTGHSPGGTAGYGNQSYPYGGGYGGGDGPYANQSSYGSGGNRGGNAYGDNGNSMYSNFGWRSDYSQGSGGGYVGSGPGAYGAPHSRQTPQ